MSLVDDVEAEVRATFAARWTERAGRVVPDTDDIQLGNDAVKLDATVLYADLAASTDLVMKKRAPFAAEILKVYLNSAARVIRSKGGVITAYDGDRVMAVFIGNSKNSDAANAALGINYVKAEIINPAIKKQYPKSSYEVRQGVGIDTGSLYVARAGVRGANDLVWVGNAANLAAKLSSFRERGGPTWITHRVYGKLNDKAKYGGDQSENMRSRRTWSAYSMTVYASTWWRRPT